MSHANMPGFCCGTLGLVTLLAVGTLLPDIHYQHKGYLWLQNSRNLKTKLKTDVIIRTAIKFAVMFAVYICDVLLHLL